MSEVSRRSGSLVEAGLLALLGAGILFDAHGYPPALGQGSPGPAFFPRLLAVLLIGCAAGLAVRASRRRETSAQPGGGAFRLAGAAAWVAGFLLALPLLGYLLALPPLVAGLMWLFGERSPRTLVAVPVTFAGFVHLLFVVTLGVRLP